MNAELREIDASEEYPMLQLWDLDDYTKFVSGSWFTSDGVHQVEAGIMGDRRLDLAEDGTHQ